MVRTFCAGAMATCVALAASDVCGDPTRDPADFAGCSAVADPSMLTCTSGTGEQAVVVPAACPYRF